MLPIRDDQPRYSTPFMNYFLIGINLAVFLFEASLRPPALVNLVFRLGVVPFQVAGVLSSSVHGSLWPVALRFLTSMFLHGSWMHVIGNMWFLYIFGDNIEDYLGHFRYFLFYLVVGVVAMITQVLIDPYSRIPTLGASGAIAGVLGAYFILYPKARVLTWFPIFFVFYLPAWIMLGYWFVVQFLSGTATALVYAGQNATPPTFCPRLCGAECRWSGILGAHRRICGRHDPNQGRPGAQPHLAVRIVKAQPGHLAGRDSGGTSPDMR